MSTEADICSFHYYSYGSSLSSAAHSHLNHLTTAVKVGIGRLVNVELHFGDFPTTSTAVNPWAGGLASIREQPGSEVWGVIWKLNQADLPELDRQNIGYFARDVDVEKDDGIIVSCRSYQLCEYVPAAPSRLYKKLIMDGALENNLPSDYISKLASIEDNGDTNSIAPSIDLWKELQKVSSQVDPDVEFSTDSDAMNHSDGYFLYFAFGSNINSKRIFVSCPSAQKVSKALLKEFSLEFVLKEVPPYHKFVGATIESRHNASTWGIVWKIDLTDLPLLDKQEHIKEKFYEPLTVSVELDSGRSLLCRTYRVLPPYSYSPPSSLYKSVILKGAEEQNLPQVYISFLKSLQVGPDFTYGPMKDSYLNATKD